MKKLNLSQMEIVCGSEKCSEKAFFWMLGAGAALTIATGGLGAWVTSGALYGCVIANS